MGFLQITARVGSAFAPCVAKWLQVVHVVLPLSLMGGSAFVAALLLLWLPETANKATAETLETDNEKENNDQSLIPFPKEDFEEKYNDNEDDDEVFHDKLYYIEKETIKDPDTGGLLSYV